MVEGGGFIEAPSQILFRKTNENGYEKRCLKMISKYSKLLNTSLECLKMRFNLKISFLGQNLAI